jgi:hypothetical protein
VLVSRSTNNHIFPAFFRFEINNVAVLIYGNVHKFRLDLDNGISWMNEIEKRIGVYTLWGHFCQYPDIAPIPLSSSILKFCSNP